MRGWDVTYYVNFVDPAISKGVNHTREKTQGFCFSKNATGAFFLILFAIYVPEILLR